MNGKIDAVARNEKIIQSPHVGLLVMGRKRPGFDPEWGALVKTRIIDRLKNGSFACTVPSENIADDGELRRAVAQCRDAEATTLVLVQPTISDGRLSVLLARLWDGPVIVWATTEKQEGAMISANSLVGSHVMAATLRQLGRSLEFVYGDPDDPEVVERLRIAILAVHATQEIRNRKYGLIGYHAPGFVDFHADPVFLNETLGSQLYHVGTPELVSRVTGYTDSEIESARYRLERLGLSGGKALGTAGDAAEAISMQARYYQAFRDLFAEERFDALAFRCWPDLPSMTGHWPYLALAVLVSEGFPIAMEGDIDGAICSRIAESAEIGPVYLSDWLEHDEKTATIWHTGAAPLQMSRDARLGVQFNNKKPTVVEATIQPDMDATLFRIWRYDGVYHMATLEGRTVEPRRDLMATNGLFFTDTVDVRDWFEDGVQRGMPHHFCVVRGHHGDFLKRVARLNGMYTAGTRSGT